MKKQTKFINKRYLIRHKLGQGGMGIVYLVEDTLRDNALFALKIIREEIIKSSEELSLNRFKTEYDIMTRLKHPNLVQVYDFGSDTGNIFYIIMEYLEGELLRDLIEKDCRLPLDRLLDIAVDILRALEFIHSRNIIYRDMKPENIMLTKVCTKLMDFGISDTTSGRQDKIRGTITYMAPEVLSGDIEFQTDIYSLGIVFYELMTGSKFFDKGKINIGEIINILKNRNDFNCYFSRMLEGIDENNISNIIKKMAAFDKKDRYFSCSEVINDINRCLHKNYSFETKDTRESYLLGGVFVNRKEELQYLKNRLAETKRGKRHLIVSGAIGTGKTSLFREFKKYCRLNDIDYFDTDCTEGELNQYYSVGEIIKQVITLTPTRLLKKYGSHLKAVQGDNPGLKEYSLLKINDPRIFKELLIENFSSFLLEFARCTRRTTVMQFNDFEWIDHGSFEILHRLIYKLGLEHNMDIPVFIYADINENLITGDNPVAELLKMENTEKINLKPFNMEHISEYVENVFGSSFIDNSIRDAIKEINERVGGNPLFLNELLKSLLDSGIILRDCKNWKLLKRISETDIPDSLVDIVKLRTSAILKDTQKKHLLQIFSLLRIDLEYENIGRIMRNSIKGHIELSAHLEDLERLEILQSEYLMDKLFYKFTSRLTKEIIKDTIADKQQMNALLAGELEYLSALNETEMYIEEIAYHYLEADMGEKAVPYLLRCSEKAKEEYFHKKAVTFYEMILRNTDEKEIDNRLDIMFRAVASLDILGRWKEAMIMLDKCIDICKGHEHILFLAEAYNLYGGFELKQGNYNTAKKMHKMALRIFKEGNEHKGVGKSYFNLATIYFLRGNFKSAIDYYQKELEISSILNDEEGVHRTLFNLTVVYYHLGKYDKALEYLEKNIEQHKKTNNKIELLKCYNNIGNVYYQKGNNAEALRFYEMCHDLSVEIGYMENMGIVTGNIGIIYEERGNYARALKCYSQKLQISQNLGYKRGISIAYGNIGNIYRLRGNLEKALNYYQRDLKISEELGDKSGVGHSYGNIAGVYKEQYDYKKAGMYYELQNKIALEIRDKQLMANYYINHANIMMQTGFFDEADFSIDKIARFAEDIENSQLDAISRYARGNLYMLKKEFDKAIVNFSEAAEIFSEKSYKHYLCLTLTKIAESYIELNKKGKSEKALKKASLISKELGLKPLTYITELLQNRLTAFINSNRAYNNLKGMEAVYTDKKYTAEINYFAFQLAGENESMVKARGIYLNLYEQSRDIVIKERLDSLC